MHRLLPFLLLSAAAGLLAINARAGAEEPRAGSTPLTRAAFVAAVASDLALHFNLAGELQLELLRAWAAPGRLARDWTVEVVEYPTLMAPSVLARCRVFADGQPAGEYTLTLRAALWRDAWAARLPLPVNGTFDPSLLEVRRVDFLRDRDALPTAVGDPAFQFVRAVQPNRLLSWRDVARRPWVRKGELVEVAAIDGQLQITMKGLAMENGAQGDTVTIRNQDSKKDFAAQVVAENRVQINF